MRKTYKGKFRPKNLSKYHGDPNKITYRSSWERQFFRWCDRNAKIHKWGSETVVVPYICKTDGRAHRYYTDGIIKWKDGSTTLIEIKPKAQTKPPAKRRKTKKFINEVMTYGKNVSKWEAAQRYALKRGWKFEIWTEDTLRSKGMKIL